MIPGLNVFVLFFALPCMLLRFGAQTPVARLLNPALLGVYAAAALVVVALTVALTVALARAGGAGRAVNLRDAAFGALVAAFPNTGFMGMPLLTGLLGAAAAAPRRATSRCRTDHPRLRRPGLLQLLRAGDLVWCK